MAYRKTVPAWNRIMDVEREFWSRVEKQERVTSHFVDTPCWIISGHKSGRYGGISFSLHGVGRKAHRYAWYLVHGPIPAGVWICHHCDNTFCVRESHLFSSTPSGNRQDSIAKGKHACGTRMSNAVMTDAAVGEARRLHVEKGMNAAMLSTLFGISRRTMSKILRRERWRHVA